MKRSFVSLVLYLVCALGISASALAIELQEGVNYQVIIPEQPPLTTSGKVEVIELFWYGCPHCHRFESTVDQWLDDKADYVEFVRLPAILRPEWALHARAYFTAEALGVADKIHKPLFNAIHAQKRKLDTEASLSAFFAEHGVKEEDFKKTLKSFSVEAKVRNATEMGRRYGVNGTPAVIINGKYRTSGSICSCSNEDVMEIVNKLAEKEQQLAVQNKK